MAEIGEFLLDASVFIAMVDGRDRNHDAAYELLGKSDHSLATIDLARYEVTNVAVAAWRAPEESVVLLGLIETLRADGGIIAPSADTFLRAADIAEEHQISAYDAAYAAASDETRRQLVSCDERDLVSNGLAILPADAL